MVVAVNMMMMFVGYYIEFVVVLNYYTFVVVGILTFVDLLFHHFDIFVMMSFVYYMDTLNNFAFDSFVVVEVLKMVLLVVVVVVELYEKNLHGVMISEILIDLVFDMVEADIYLNNLYHEFHLLLLSLVLDYNNLDFVDILVEFVVAVEKIDYIVFGNCYYQHSKAVVGVLLYFDLLLIFHSFFLFFDLLFFGLFLSLLMV